MEGAGGSAWKNGGISEWTLDQTAAQSKDWRNWHVGAPKDTACHQKGHIARNVACRGRCQIRQKVVTIVGRGRQQIESIITITVSLLYMIAEQCSVSVTHLNPLSMPGTCSPKMSAVTANPANTKGHAKGWEEEMGRKEGGEKWSGRYAR